MHVKWLDADADEIFKPYYDYFRVHPELTQKTPNNLQSFQYILWN